MVASRKKVKQSQNPRGNSIGQGGNPDKFYEEKPSWNFSSCDKQCWNIYSDNVQALFWEEIFPYLQNLESRTWADILIKSKKQNHSIEVNSLNKDAINRLEELYIEAESIISLRITATHRIYGFMNGAVYNILWIDLYHGDNDTCVCRSKKKYT